MPDYEILLDPAIFSIVPHVLAAALAAVGFLIVATIVPADAALQPSAALAEQLGKEKEEAKEGTGVDLQP